MNIADKEDLRELLLKDGHTRNESLLMLHIAELDGRILYLRDLLLYSEDQRSKVQAINDDVKRQLYDVMEKIRELKYV